MITEDNLRVLCMSAYFYFRQRIPLIFYVLTIHLKNKVKYRNYIMNFTLKLIGILTIYTLIGFTLNTIFGNLPFDILLPIKWRYSGSLTWGVFTLICYTRATKICATRIEAMNLAVLAVFGGGWLYEVPYFHPFSMFFSSNSILYLNGQIVCLILLLYELHKRGIKPKLETIITLANYIGFSTFLVMNRNYIQFEWFHRIPTTLLLLALIENTPRFSGVRERNLNSWFEEIEAYAPDRMCIKRTKDGR